MNIPLRQGLLIVAVGVFIAGVWVIWQYHSRKPYAHTLYEREQVLRHLVVKRQQDEKAPDCWALIRQADMQAKRIRTLRAIVRHHEVCYPARAVYIAQSQRLLLTKKKPTSPPRDISQPLTNRSVADWRLDVPHRRFKVQVTERDYNQKTGAILYGAHSDVIAGSCDSARCLKIYQSGYAGYAHRVVLSPRQQDFIGGLLLEVDSWWLLFLANHYRVPLVGKGNSFPSHFWSYVFGDGGGDLDRFASSAVVTYAGIDTLPTGERCHVVAVAQNARSQAERLWLWLSIPHDMVCVRSEQESKDFVQVWRIDRLQHVNGVWLPTSCTYEQYLRLASSSDSRVASKYVLADKISVQIEPVAVNTPLSEDTFTLQMPSSAWIDDRFQNRLYPFGEQVMAKRGGLTLSIGAGVFLLALIYIVWKLGKKTRGVVG